MFKSLTWFFFFLNYNLPHMYYFFFYIKSFVWVHSVWFFELFQPVGSLFFSLRFFFFLTWYLFNFLLYSLAFFIYYLYIHFVYFVGSLAHFKFTYLFSGMVPSFLASFIAISSISIWQFNSLLHLFLKQCFQCLWRLESVLVNTSPMPYTLMNPSWW